MPKFIVTDCQGCWVYFKHVIEAADEDGALESYSDDGPTGETIMEVGDSIDGMDGSFNVEPATAESLSAFAAESKVALFDEILAALRDCADDLKAFRNKHHPSEWPDKPIVHTTVLRKAEAAIAKAESVKASG